MSPRRRVRPGRVARGAGLVLTAAAVLLPPSPTAATTVKIFLAQSQAAFLAGTFEGISVDPLGRLRLADRVERLAAIDEPFVLAAAAHPDGWVVGTGNAGRVLLIDRKGAVRQLFAADEPEVFALLADPDGTVWAASSPGGKVYRIARDGTAEVYFDPGETYLWALARAADGALLVATGTQGRLYRVDAQGRGAVVYDGDDTHLRSLLARPDGSALVGTAGEGLVLALTPGAGGWTARTLYDASEPEVVALAAGPEGEVYAGLVASEASRVDLSAAADDEGEGGAGVTVTVSADGSPTVLGSRPAGFSGPRSEVVRIAPGGLVDRVWEFTGDTVYDLAWRRDRLWVATGVDGELYSFDGSQMVLEKDVDESQVVALVEDEPGPAFATTNASAFYRVAGGTERQGTYTSAALDAGRTARFGVLRWRGEVPPGGSLELSFRSGVSAEPDRTWTEWSRWQPTQGRSADDRLGGELALAAVPQARYLQWRARLSAGDGASPRIDSVEVSYRQANLEPRIDSLTVMAPGEILVPSNFNPSNQAYEPVSPNREGIFTTLGAAENEDRSKTLWKKGYRTLRWKAKDDNGDGLRYSLAFRPQTAGPGSAAAAAAAAAAENDGWLSMVDDLGVDSYSFDSTALPDGLYRFRLTASDGDANDPGDGLAAERLSEPVTVDNSVPRLVEVRGSRGDGGLVAVVEDDWSPLRQAELSVDAGEWRPAVPADGLLDGRREELRIEVPAGARLVLLRVVDAAFNTVTFDLGAAGR